jgi:hypothetical protein
LLTGSAADMNPDEHAKAYVAMSSRVAERIIISTACSVEWAKTGVPVLSRS